MIEELPELKIGKYAYDVPDPLVVFERFANSELGEELRGRARFHSFKSKNILDQKWIDSAGPDTDNLLHMMETYRLTEAFLAESAGFSKREKELLLFSAIVHDIGEVVDGDIPQPDKTEEQEAEEMSMFSGILEYFLRDDMDEYERYNLIGDVVDVISDWDSKLGRAFNAIEKLGYNTTALNSWRGYRVHKNDEKDKGLRDGFRSLAHEVVLGDMPKLVEYSREYPYVNSYLSQNEHYILDVINDADTSGFYDELKVRQARSSLDEFSTSFAS